jgi:DNA-binding MarR family transcriptional regulator
MPKATGETNPGVPGDTVEIDGLVQLSFAVQEILHRAAAAHDLSLTQLRLLGIVRDRRPTMAALAAYLGLDPSSVSGLIDRAERRDLVRRETASHDGRVTEVVITDRGRQFGAALAAEIAAPLRTLLAGLPATQRAALAALADTLDGTRALTVAQDDAKRS